METLAKMAHNFGASSLDPLLSNYNLLLKDERNDPHLVLGDVFLVLADNMPPPRKDHMW